MDYKNSIKELKKRNQYIDSKVYSISQAMDKYMGHIDFISEAMDLGTLRYNPKMTPIENHTACQEHKIAMDKSDLENFFSKKIIN